MAKEKVIFYSFYYTRLDPMLRELAARTDMRIVTEFDPAEVGLPEDRFVKAEDIIPKEDLLQPYEGDKPWRLPEIEMQAEAEISKIYSSARKGVLAGFTSLPHFDQFNPEDGDALSDYLDISFKDVYYQFALFERIRAYVDIQAFVCSCSPLDRNQAAIALAKYYDIPTIHINHGSFARPDYRYPEAADVSLVADDFCKEIIERTRASKTKVIASGLPFITPPMRLESKEEDAQRRRKGKEAFGLDENEEVVLYLGRWIGSRHIVQLVFAYKIIEVLQGICKIAKKRNEQGKSLTLLVRLHPTNLPQEEEASIVTIAKSVGFSKVIFANELKQEAFDAADVVFNDQPGSSTVLDVLAAGRSLVVDERVPYMSNVVGDSLLGDCVVRVRDDEGLEKALFELLDNKERRFSFQKRGHDLIESYRTITPEESLDNICKVILSVADKGLSALE